MQFTYLPAEECFFVPINEDAMAQYPEGAFSAVANYPVYAMRVRDGGEGGITEFLIPSSEGDFRWVDMRHARLARR